MTSRDDVDDVLEDIEEALAWEAQWERSAMRWTPDLEGEPPSDETFADLVRAGRLNHRATHHVLEYSRDAFRRHVNDSCTLTPSPSAIERIQASVARLAGSFGFTLAPWQEAMVERVFQDLDQQIPALSGVISTPRPTPTVMYAFHDEDGRLRITSDPAEAADAPGPVSIGLDPAAPREPAAAGWIDPEVIEQAITSPPGEARRMWLDGWAEDGCPRAST